MEIKVLNGKYYFASEDIKVFPCAYRGTSAVNILDPESRATSEHNLTRAMAEAGSHTSDSYIVGLQNEDKTLVCVVGGYRFEIGTTAHPFNRTDLVNALRNSEGTGLDIYFNIVTAIVDDNMEVLGSWDDMSVSYLDKSGAFTGLLIAKSASTDSRSKSLHAFTPRGSSAFLNESAKQAEIYHGAKPRSLMTDVEGKSTADGQVIIGKNAVNDNASFIVADNNRHNKIEIEQDTTKITNDKIAVKGDTEIDGTLIAKEAFTANKDVMLEKTADSQNAADRQIVIGTDKKLHTKDMTVNVSSSGNLTNKSFDVITKVSQQADGKISAQQNKVTVTDSTEQGEFKINGEAQKICGLGENDSPTFKELTVGKTIKIGPTGNISAEHLNVSLAHIGTLSVTAGEFSDAHMNQVSLPKTGNIHFGPTGANVPGLYRTKDKMTLMNDKAIDIQSAEPITLKGTTINLKDNNGSNAIEIVNDAIKINSNVDGFRADKIDVANVAAEKLSLKSGTDTIEIKADSKLLLNVGAAIKTDSNIIADKLKANRIEITSSDSNIAANKIEATTIETSSLNIKNAITTIGVKLSKWDATGKTGHREWKDLLCPSESRTECWIRINLSNNISLIVGHVAKQGEDTWNVGDINNGADEPLYEIIQLSSAPTIVNDAISNLEGLKNVGEWIQARPSDSIKNTYKKTKGLFAIGQENSSGDTDATGCDVILIAKHLY